DRVDAHAHELAREPQRRRKAQDAGAALLDFANRNAARQTAGEHDMTNPMLGAYLDELEQLRMQRDQVDAKGTLGEPFGCGDLSRQEFWRHRPRGNDSKPPGVRNSGDQIALRHPGHCAAHDSEIASENVPAANPEPIQLGNEVLALEIRLPG